MSDISTDEGAERREQVRARYAAAAQAASGGEAGTADCCGAAGDSSFGQVLYAEGDRAALPEAATLASLGCGNPAAVAELRAGETVLDLGSGGGIDVLLSAARVGPTGKVYGVDMTDEMLELAGRNAAEAGATNVEFLKGLLEDIPLASSTVDVVISNCVINLSMDKTAVVAEMFRVLRPGGRIGISDVVAEDQLSPAERETRGSYVGCIAGALSKAEYEQGLAQVGFTEVTVTFTHEVADGMHGAIVKAVKPDNMAGQIMKPPEACTLGPDDGPVRMSRWRRLMVLADPEARRAGPLLEVHFRPEPGVRDELEALAAAEQQCCSFVGWTVSADAGHLVLRVVADPDRPDDLDPIARSFGAP